MATAAQAILTGGVDRELDDVFRTISDSHGASGPRYGQRTIRELARSVAGRAYAKPLLELCHFIRAVHALRTRHGYPGVFWGMDVVRPSAFRSVFASAKLGSDYVMNDDMITIRYDQEEFSISFSRMPFLAALLEFSITALGFETVDEHLIRMVKFGHTFDSTSYTSNQMARGLYDYLADKLPTAQNLRKFNLLVGFMAEQRGDEFSLDDIDDEAVFAFWDQDQFADGNTVSDFRTYRATVETFIRFRIAFSEGVAKLRLETTKPIGSDWDAGEVDPGDLTDGIEISDNTESKLAKFLDPPMDAIKFLNKSETAALELICRAGPHALSLPLSILRSEVFGSTQSKLTQALRRKSSVEDIAALIGQEPDDSPQRQVRAWKKIDTHLGNAIMAGIFVLSDQARAEAFTTLMAIYPDVDLSPLRAALTPDPVVHSNVVAIGGGQVKALTVNATNKEIVGDEIAAIFDTARRAFKSIARKGFSEADAANPDIGDGFAEGCEVCKSVAEDLSKYVACLEGRLEQASSAQGNIGQFFAHDREKFASRFHSLYGV